MQASSPSVHERDQRSLPDAERAIVRSETIIALQHRVIAATERVGRDAARDRALLATMEGNLGELKAWRTYLLDGPAAEQKNGEAVPGHHNGPALLAAPRSALLAQTEELIGRGEQNRTRLLVLINRRTAAGLLPDGTGDLLRMIEGRLARLHARRRRLLP
jgi:hypothetical protein